MTSDRPQVPGTRHLPSILLAAVVQGWALYGLHFSIKHNAWPATDTGVLFALYALALFVPLTLQILVEHLRQPVLWIAVGVMSICFAFFGWHHGAHVMPECIDCVFRDSAWVPFAFILLLLWLLSLPFLQSRLMDGRWQPRYELLFSMAWRNKIILAEAALFTALFWVLLILWQALFGMLKIRFFTELFTEPVFIYPVTALTFGCALHLIGSVEKLVSVVLEQLLNVLKWLAVVAGILLTLFSVALAFKLPEMVASSHSAISSAWLLWLTAITVLLVNAAFRDGKVERPYPRPVAQAFRFVVPLTVLIAFTAVYAMYLRVDSYGLTVSRVWALVVTAAACFYAVGYSIAAVRPGAWMANVARVNIGVALFLIAILCLALTPVLSPFKLAANSQYEMALLTEQPVSPRNVYESPLYYLRRDAGRYGVDKLAALASLQDHPHAERIRTEAQRMQKDQDPRASDPEEIERRLANIRLHPSDRRMPEELRQFLVTDLQDSRLYWMHYEPYTDLGGVFIDLDADGVEEFVLVTSSRLIAYTHPAEAAWQRIGEMSSDVSVAQNELLRRALEGELQVQRPRWAELRLGQRIFRLHVQ